MLHPLLTSLYCPFNLLRSFKDDVLRSKRISSSFKIRICVRFRIRISMHVCRNRDVCVSVTIVAPPTVPVAGSGTNISPAFTIWKQARQKGKSIDSVCVT